MHCSKYPSLHIPDKVNWCKQKQFDNRAISNPVLKKQATEQPQSTEGLQKK